MSLEEQKETFKEVEDAKRAKGVSAVTKMSLIRIREYDPSIFVFVFEGDDDKIIYAQWLSRISPRLKYEPLPCEGKRNVLAFRDSLLLDEAGLRTNVLFFIDRDFNDLCGRKNGNDIFMTDRYSVENYLVSERVLDALLKTGFHCESYSVVRAKLLSLFSTLYLEFLSTVKEVNFRIFVARQRQIGLLNEKQNLSKLWLSISLETIGASGKTAAEIVELADNVSEEEYSRLRKKFDKLDPKKRYRGKFSLTFFNTWLAALKTEWRSTGSTLLAEITERRPIREQEFNVGNFASKSELPKGLRVFLRKAGALK
ncbi:MAG: DUF4435 domain-containing protein [Roseomonas sp.]|nr:DUF4435 domain-containing protein [Roseomonas sp.]MCA3296858.1 DUF4435 domain-containing protein [Roseomonas sp.]